MKVDLAVIFDEAGFQTSDIAHLASKNLTCVSSFTGVVLGLKWNRTLKTFESVFRVKAFKAAITKISFSESGKYLICGSSDGNLCLLKSETGRVKLKVKDLFSSKASIGAFVSLDAEDKQIAVGNDDGDVKIVNLENLTEPVIKTFDNFNDQVTDMVYFDYRKTLICSSGDGTILVIDLKKLKIISHSETFDDEITSILGLKSGARILCATGLGFVNVFEYNYWGAINDRLPQHPASINCMTSEGIETRTLYTGCSDGFIRVLTVDPSSLRGEIVQLDDSVEKICYMKIDDQTSYILGSTCSDGAIHVIDLMDSSLSKEDLSARSSGKRRKISAKDNKESEEKKTFFADLE